MSPRKRHLLPDGILDLASAIPGQFLREELQAEAIGYFAEARRIRGDLKGAEGILLEMSETLAEVPADSRERATRLFRQVAVRADQGSTDEALDLTPP